MMVKRTIAQLTPHVAIVLGSVFIMGLAIFLAASLIGGYLITRGIVNSQQHAQLAGAKRECTALKALDQADNGIVFPKVNPEHPSEEALTRLFSGIHRVYDDSGCPAILSGHLPR